MLQGQWELQGGLLSLTVFPLTTPFSRIICSRSGHRGHLPAFHSLFYSSSSSIFLCTLPNGPYSSLFLLRLLMLWWLKTGNSAKRSSRSCHRVEALLIQSRWCGTEHTPLLFPLTGDVGPSTAHLVPTHRSSSKCFSEAGLVCPGWEERTGMSSYFL